MLLGATSTSRLNLNLREGKTYSYGGHTRLERRRGSGAFEFHTSVAREDTARAMQEIHAEVERLRHEELSAEELETVQRAATRRLPIQFATVETSVGALMELAAHDLPADYRGSLAERISDVTAADLRRIASEHLAPERLRWFVLADREFLVTLQLSGAVAGESR